MAIRRWNPIHEVNRFFDDVFDNLPTRFGFDLAVDLYQEGDHLIAEMSLPGIDIEHTDVSVVGNVLRISGERESQKEEQKKSYYSKEIHRGQFERTIRLPSEVVPDETKAQYKAGVLKVLMPLKRKGEQKKIPITEEE